MSNFSFSGLARLPITIILIVSAAYLSFYRWANHITTAPDIAHKPWELFLTILPHVNPMHLIFNAYWTFIFGRILEPRFGSLCYAVIILLIAVISSAGEFALLSGGIGLSGVVYGLFAILWLLGKRDFKLFAHRLIPMTIYIFIGWFFFCIFTTYSGTAPIANIAHGLGAAAGALIAMITYTKPPRRTIWIAATAAVTLLSISAALFFRSQVNLRRFDAAVNYVSAEDLAYEAYIAIEQGNPAKAAQLYEYATQNSRAPHDWFHNLGVVYNTLGRYDDAATAFRTAAHMKDAPASDAADASNTLLNAGVAEWTKGNLPAALDWLKKSVDEDNVAPNAWYYLGNVHESLGQFKEARHAYTEASHQEPTNKLYVDALNRMLTVSTQETPASGFQGPHPK